VCEDKQKYLLVGGPFSGETRETERTSIVLAISELDHGEVFFKSHIYTRKIISKGFGPDRSDWEACIMVYSLYEKDWHTVTKAALQAIYDEALAAGAYRVRQR